MDNVWENNTHSSNVVSLVLTKTEVASVVTIQGPTGHRVYNVTFKCPMSFIDNIYSSEDIENEEELIAEASIQIYQQLYMQNGIRNFAAMRDRIINAVRNINNQI